MHTPTIETETRGRRTVLWLVPTLYGVLLLAASAWWLVVGEPFDRGTYERIGRMPWQALTREITPAQASVMAAMIKLLGGNGGLVAGGLTIAVASFGHRSGATWAWFSLWLLPLHALLDLAIVASSGGWSAMAAVWDGGWAATMIIVLMASSPFRSGRPKTHVALADTSHAHDARGG